MTKLLSVFIFILAASSVSSAKDEKAACRFLLTGSQPKPLYVKTYKNYGSAYEYEPNNASSHEHRPRQRILNDVIEAQLISTNMGREWLHIGYTIKKFDLETILLAIGGRKFRGLFKGPKNQRIQKFYKFVFSSDFNNRIMEKTNLSQDVTRLFTMDQLAQTRTWVFKQYSELADIDFSSVNASNIGEFLRFFKAQYGEELLIARIEHEYFDFPEDEDLFNPAL